METTAAAHPRTGVRFHLDPDRSVRSTYPELSAQAKSDAVGLWNEGLHPGARVVLAYDTGPDFLRALYACAYAGLTFVPAASRIGSVGHLRDSLLSICGSARPQAVLTAPGLSPSTSASKVIHLPPTGTVHAHQWRPPAVTADSVALIQYTSGSTTTPKGVMVSHANLLANQRGIAAMTAQPAPADVVGWLPHYHDMGLVGQYLHSVFYGHELTATSPAQFLRRPVFWLHLITRYRATITAAPDFAYRLCIDRVTDADMSDLDLSSLRVAITGAEPVRAETIRLFSERFAAVGFAPDAFQPAYGMAEATLLVSAKRAGRPVTRHLVDSASMEQGMLRAALPGQRTTTLVSCGPPMPDHRVVIDSGADDAVGEIWVSGPSVSNGYLEGPSDRFGLEVDAHPGVRFYRTGDLGVLLDGEVVVTGRMDDLINVRGRNVYPTDIEAAVARALEQAGRLAVVAFSTGEDHVFVLVETRAGSDQVRLAEDAHDLLVQELSLNPVTVVLVPRGSIPRSTSGKLRRPAARSKFLDGGFTIMKEVGSTWAGTGPTCDESSVAMTPTRIEAWLFEQVLEITGDLPVNAGPDTPLSLLGLTSVAGQALCAEIEDELDVVVGPELLWDHPTIRQLASILATMAGQP